jgi:hypothetical protein
MTLFFSEFVVQVSDPLQKNLARHPCLFVVAIFNGKSLNIFETARFLRSPFGMKGQESGAQWAKMQWKWGKLG